MVNLSLYKKILVPHDGSEYADKALDHAIQIAKMSGADTQIILLNVVQKIYLPPSFSSTDYQFRSKSDDQITREEYLKELHLDIKDAMLKMLNERKQRCESLGILTKTSALVGYVAETIIEFANEEKVDLIVMGSKGLRGISRIIALGSVSRTVSERANRPVLLIH